MGEKTLPLYGKRVQSKLGGQAGLVTRQSDCESIAPPKHVNDKHSEIHKLIDRRKVVDGEKHGFISYNEQEITEWNIDEKLL